MQCPCAIYQTPESLRRLYWRISSGPSWCRGEVSVGEGWSWFVWWLVRNVVPDVWICLGKEEVVIRRKELVSVWLKLGGMKLMFVRCFVTLNVRALKMLWFDEYVGVCVEKCGSRVMLSDWCWLGKGLEDRRKPVMLRGLSLVGRGIIQVTESGRLRLVIDVGVCKTFVKLYRFLLVFWWVVRVICGK